MTLIWNITYHELDISWKGCTTSWKEGQKSWEAGISMAIPRSEAGNFLRAGT